MYNLFSTKNLDIRLKIADFFMAYANKESDLSFLEIAGELNALITETLVLEDQYLDDIFGTIMDTIYVTTRDRFMNCADEGEIEVISEFINIYSTIFSTDIFPNVHLFVNLLQADKLICYGRIPEYRALAISDYKKVYSHLDDTICKRFHYFKYNVCIKLMNCILVTQLFLESEEDAQFFKELTDFVKSMRKEIEIDVNYSMPRYLIG